MKKMKSLEGEGEIDYDLKQDILFFKTKYREYVKSIEIDNITLDVDSKGFITGIQIFEASKFLKIHKQALVNIPKWRFHATVFEGRLEVRLVFQVKVRNKIIEKNPIIMESLKESLPNSEFMCAIA